MGPVGGRANGWTGRILGRRKGAHQLEKPRNRRLSAIFAPKWLTTRGRPLGMPRRPALDDPGEFPNIIVANTIDGRMTVGLRKGGRKLGRGGPLL